MWWLIGSALEFWNPRFESGISNSGSLIVLYSIVISDICDQLYLHILYTAFSQPTKVCVRAEYIIHPGKTWGDLLSTNLLMNLPGIRPCHFHLTLPSHGAPRCLPWFSPRPGAFLLILSLTAIPSSLGFSLHLPAWTLPHNSPSGRSPSWGFPCLLVRLHPKVVVSPLFFEQPGWQMSLSCWSQALLSTSSAPRSAQLGLLGSICLFLAPSQPFLVWLANSACICCNYCFTHHSSYFQQYRAVCWLPFSHSNCDAVDLHLACSTFLACSATITAVYMAPFRSLSTTISCISQQLMSVMGSGEPNLARWSLHFPSCSRSRCPSSRALTAWFINALPGAPWVGSTVSLALVPCASCTFSFFPLFTRGTVIPGDSFFIVLCAFRQ